MSRNITPIVNTDTVEEWFNKTNLMIDAIQDAVTIGDGEINTGNVVLNGDLSVQEANVSAINVLDTLLDTIPVNAALNVSSSTAKGITLNTPESPNPDGSKISYAFQDTDRWELGVFDEQYEIFGIKNADRQYELTLATNETGTGTLSGTNITIDKGILPATIDSNTTGDAGTCSRWKTARTVGFATGDVTGEFVIDGSSNVQNVVLTVKDNSHAHQISNIEGLSDELNGKQNYDQAIDSIAQLTDQFGILVRSSTTKIEPKVLVPGDGIAIQNGGGVSGQPTIGHADTSSAVSPENTGATFIQNLGFDKFGHVTQVQSVAVPVSSTYVSGQQTISGGASLAVDHGLGARPFMVEGFLICTDADAGFAVGDMVSLASAGTNDITVYANATKVGFRCRNVVEINLVNNLGQSVQIANTKWKLVIKGVL